MALTREHKSRSYEEHKELRREELLRAFMGFREFFDGKAVQVIINSVCIKNP